MLLSFFKYFFFYIFRAKTRQKLLFLAITGLFISSMALVILQSSMGGLQNSLINRSKAVQGKGIVILYRQDEQFARQLLLRLQQLKIDAYLEYEIELLLRHDAYISPVIAHGIDVKNGPPPFLHSDQLSEMILPADLAIKLNVDIGEQLQLISPSHVDSLMGDVPRAVSSTVAKVISTSVPEVDMYHLWVRSSLLQNLVRKKVFNRIVINSNYDATKLQKELNMEGLELKSWEQQNETLVFALRLETTVMIFLFICMTMLVSLCITSGLMLFFDKVKGDLASFWILGASEKKLERASGLFLHLLSLGAILAGLFTGLLFLFLLDRYGANIMPDVFVDRKIPVHITISGIIISVFVPYLISLTFSFFSLGQFKKERSYLDQVRIVG